MKGIRAVVAPRTVARRFARHRVPLGLEIDAELLAFLVEVAALEAERARGLGHAVAVRRAAR